VLRVELHCHSTFSDGSFAATEVAERAAKTGVKVFCLTDHDTCAGYDETRAVLEPLGITVLRGLELSCRANDRNVHVLLYGLVEGPGLDRLRERLDRVHEERCERLVAICARLQKLGITIDANALLARSHGRSPGRPDVARALVKAGVVKTPQDAFTRFLRDGGPADVTLDRLSVADGVALGAAAGAKASLAHPHTFGEYAQVRDMLRTHREHGLHGVEAFYGTYPRAETERWLRIADELDLVPTGGSDFHGEMNPAVTQPGILLPQATAERLCAWLDLPARCAV
jgi:predicted metal-dependent phosphoesterase TrpH